MSCSIGPYVGLASGSVWAKANVSEPLNLLCGWLDRQWEITKQFNPNFFFFPCSCSRRCAAVLPYRVCSPVSFSPSARIATSGIKATHLPIARFGFVKSRGGSLARSELSSSLVGPTSTNNPPPSLGPPWRSRAWERGRWFGSKPRGKKVRKNRGKNLQ